MSYDSPGAYQQKFLPHSVEDRLVGVLGRLAGFALLALTTFLWLSLITWTSTDPSLTRATSGPVANLMGPLGAIFSDLILQMLGLAAIVLLLAPMFWSIELILYRYAPGFRSKFAFYPVSVLLVAGAVSSLPSSIAWPFESGYGGILGDFVFGLGASAFALINTERAALATGLVLFAAGFSTAVHSLGMEIRQLVDVVRAPSYRKAWRNSAGTWQTSLLSEAQRLKANVRTAVDDFGPTLSGLPAAPKVEQPSPPQSMATTVPVTGLEPLPPHPMMPAVTSMAYTAPSMAQNASHLSSSAPWGEQDLEPAHVMDDDDDVFSNSLHDDEADMSCDIARRFAPASIYGEEERAVPARDLMHTPPQRPQVADSAPVLVAPAAGPVRPTPPPAEPAPTPAPASHAPAPSEPERGIAPAVADVRPAPQAQPAPALSRQQPAPGYQRPPLTMLSRPASAAHAGGVPQAALRTRAEQLQLVLADFGVKGMVTGVRPGPVVTLYEFEPDRGIKASRVIGLADDIARSISALSARVAVVPGRSVIGIELPNPTRQAVLLRELLEAETYRSSQAFLPIALGKSIGGEPVVADLARMPHLLVAGTTGSGKSVGVNTMILSILYRHAPEDCRLLMIDPKMLELSVYNDIPHLLTPVVTEPQKAVAALNWVVKEMEERYKRMTKLSVRNIGVYNNRVRSAKKRGERLARTVHTGFDASGQPVYERQEMHLEPMPYIVVVVDEFADLMLVAGKEIEAAIQRLAQMARAAGIHLIMATQRPSVDVITGTIKANFPTRISFKVTSKVDSRTILNEQGAEQLLGQGDMLYAAGNGTMTRVHGSFVSDEEVEAIAGYLRSLSRPQYVDGVTDLPPEATSSSGSGRGQPANGNDLYEQAVAIVVGDRKASTSYLQRRLSIGYNRAADLIERMEAEGLISAANSVGKREILADAAAPSTVDAA